MEEITILTTKQNQSTSKRHFIGLASLIKTLIVTLALWGFIPYRLADWLIRWGGLRNA